MKKFFLITCLFLAGSLGLRAQIELNSDAEILYGGRMYDVNLPQYGLAITLPANAGFEPPRLYGKKVLLEWDDDTLGELKDQVYYYMDTSYTDYGELFLFYVDSKTKSDDALYMQLIRQDPEDMLTREALLESVPKRSKLLPSFNTELGSTVSVQVAESKEKNDWHIVITDNYVYAFVFETKLSKKKKEKYLGMVKSITSKDWSSQLEAYQAKIDSGYFAQYEDDDSYMMYDGQDQYSSDLVKMNGVLDQTTTMRWQDFGIEMVFPAGWSYRFDCADTTTVAQDSWIISMSDAEGYSTDDVDHSFEGDGMRMRLLLETYGYYRDVDAEIQVDAERSDTTYTQEISLDGIPAYASYVGSPYYGKVTLHFMIEDNGYQMIFTGVTQENLPALNRFLASVQIDAEGSEEMKEEEPITTELNFPLQAAQVFMGLDSTALKLPNVNSDHSFQVRIPQIGLGFSLPGTLEQYEADLSYYSTYELLVEDSIPTLPSSYSNPLTIESTSQPVSLKVELEERPMDWEKYTKSQRDDLAMYKDIRIMRAAVETVNDLEWSEIIYYNETEKKYEGQFVTQRGNYKVTLCVEGYYTEEVFYHYAAFAKSFFTFAIPEPQLIEIDSLPVEEAMISYRGSDQ